MNWPIITAASTALASSFLWAPRLYDAWWRVKMDRYKFRRIQEMDDILAEKERQSQALAGIRHFAPNADGRLGTTYDGETGTYHNMDTHAIFNQWKMIYVDPLAERLLAMEKLLRAMPQSPSAHTAVEQMTQSSIMETQDPWAAYPIISLVQLLGDRQPTIHDMIIGAKPTVTGGLEVVSMPLHDLMHILIVGASGWGKSTWLRAFLYQLALVNEPVEVVAVDINGSAFNALSNWGKLRYPVARTAEEAVAVLGGVCGEIDRRKGLYEQYPTVENLNEYNAATGTGMPPWIVVIDEGTNLLNQPGIGEPLRAVVQTARQYGVYVLLAGQSAKHSVVDTQVRDNMSTRMCVRTSPTSSRVVLSNPAAGTLTVKGRAYVQMVGRELCELQGPWIAKSDFIAALGNGGPRDPMPITVCADPVSFTDKVQYEWENWDWEKRPKRNKRQMCLALGVSTGGSGFDDVCAAGIKLGYWTK